MSGQKKIMIFNTLTFILCAVIVGLFCINPKQEKVLEKYKVVFDSTGGNYIEALEIEEGDIASVPVAPTKDGYEFVGWMLGDELYDFSEKVSGDITLKAEWKELDPEITYYTIDFDPAGGPYINPLVLEAGSVPTEPATPVRNGYEFVGWYANGVLFDFTLPLNQNVKLVAQWVEVKQEEPEKPTDPEKPEETKTYTVKFNLNGGTGSIATQTVKAGEKAKKPSDPSRSGYTFNGWLLNSAKGKAYNFNSKVNSNITLYAYWKAIPTPTKKYTVRFIDSDGKSVLGTATVEAGRNATAPTSPKKAFYRFDGWYTSLTGGTSVGSTKVNQSMDFYARYSESTVTVSCPKNSNEFNAAAGNCKLQISISSGGYLPSGAVADIVKTKYTSGSTIMNGQFIAATKQGISVCESASSGNCKKANVVSQ